MNRKRLFCLLLAAVMVLTAAACGRGQQNNEAQAGTANASAGAAAGDGADPNGGSAGDSPEGGKTIEELIAEKNNTDAVLEAGGKSYGLRKGLKSYLFIGVDHRNDGVEDGQTVETGNSDVMHLYIVDETNKQYRVLELNRDTVVTVDILNAYGTVVGQTRQQLSFAFGYSTDAKANCENVVRAISKLLGGIQIDGYAALYMDSIILLNDAVGGVDVKIEDDFSKMDPTLVMGETVHLEGQHAENFVRGRMSVGDGSNTARMRRQRVYMNALTAKIRSEVKNGHSGIVNDLYNAAAPYLVSNMSSGSITNLMLKCAGYSQQTSKTLSGTSREVTYNTGNTHTEYTLDQASLDQTILELFYTELD